MRRKKHLTISLAAFGVILGSLAITTTVFAASSEKVLYSFCSANNCVDGQYPIAAVIFDKAGNLYGTTLNGGAYGYGTVFQLVPNHGKWTEKVLHSFCAASGCSDGVVSFGGLILDASGNLYGTTQLGGLHDCGVVFELIRNNGEWTYPMLYNFAGRGDGCGPQAGLILDAGGNLYGTTGAGGAYGDFQTGGTVFELLAGNGTWTERILHSFNPSNNGEQNPIAGLVSDAAGNLYGTTAAGGGYGCYQNSGCGVVFKMISNSTWTYQVLHRFMGGDGSAPAGSLILGASGNLYGTTESGGNGGCFNREGCGTVFELSQVGLQWTERVLHVFNYRYGAVPVAGLMRDHAGNLYGTTQIGGEHSSRCRFGCGDVFESTLDHSEWKDRVLHGFSDGKDGAAPEGSLVMDAAGNVYGTAYAGGIHAAGVVFKITP